MTETLQKMTDLGAFSDSLDGRFKKFSDEAGCQARMTAGLVTPNYFTWNAVDNDPLGLLHANRKDIMIPETGLWDIFVAGLWSSSTGAKGIQIYDNVAKENVAIPAGAVLFETSAGPAVAGFIASFLDVPLIANRWYRLLSTASSGTPTFTGRLSIRRSGSPFG